MMQHGPAQQNIVMYRVRHPWFVCFLLPTPIECNRPLHKDTSIFAGSRLAFCKEFAKFKKTTAVDYF